MMSHQPLRVRSIMCLSLRTLRLALMLSRVRSYYPFCIFIFSLLLNYLDLDFHLSVILFWKLNFIYLVLRLSLLPHQWPPNISTPSIFPPPVCAHDGDTGSNSEIRYILEETSPLVEEPVFTLDPYSGWLSLNQELDAEEKSKYELTVSYGGRVQVVVAVLFHYSHYR